jgi:hypothetical protein
MRFIQAMSPDDQEAKEASGSRFMRPKVIIPVVIIVFVLLAGFFEVSAYEQGVVQTTVVTGTITTVQAPAQSQAALPAPGAAPAAAVPAVGGSNSLTYVGISVGSASITQALACSNVRYAAGQTIKVADEQLRDGAHRYLPDVACRGMMSPFQTAMSSQTTTSSSR